VQRITLLKGGEKTMALKWWLIIIALLIVAVPIKLIIYKKLMSKKNHDSNSD